MGDIRKQHACRFKTEVAVSAISGYQAMPELSSEYGGHASAINRWENRHWRPHPKF